MTIRSDKKIYQPRNYKEITKNTFEKLYVNHKRSFKINMFRNDMELSPSVECWN